MPRNKLDTLGAVNQYYTDIMQKVGCECGASDFLYAGRSRHAAGLGDILLPGGGSEVYGS